MIDARDVARSFDTPGGVIEAFGPLDLRVEAGEFLMLLGPSGCGKSTLLRVFAGLLNPSAGAVEIGPTQAHRSHPTAMVFQDHGIYPWKTVRGNVRFPLEVAGVPNSQADERVGHWLDRVGIRDFADAYPSTLSGGMRQRVGIARAFAADPEILLMDEPFGALDAQTRAVLQQELLGIWEDDRRTVVFVTHSIEEALMLGDRVMVMSARPGRILEDITVPFPRPRGHHVRREPDFARLHEHIWETLQREVEATMRPQRALS